MLVDLHHRNRMYDLWLAAERVRGGTTCHHESIGTLKYGDYQQVDL